MLGVAPEALAVYLGSADLNGDGTPEGIYSNGPNVQIKKANGALAATYYIGPSWYGVALADLDGSPGAEYAVRTFSTLFVITHRTKKVFPYALGNYSAAWTPMTVDQFDGAAGNEIAVNAGMAGNGYGSILFVSHRTHSIKQHWFLVGWGWAGVDVNDFDGVPGKEYAVNTTSIGYLAVLHPRNLVPRYYWVGANMQFLGSVNLDGAPGLEIKMRGYGGLVYRIYDRTGTMKY